MKIKGIIFEDFVNYRLPCMTIEMPYCDFKCDKECGRSVCQNSALATAPIIEHPQESIIRAYRDNPIARAICFQGLEPFDSFEEMYSFIYKLRISFSIDDDIVIYTGYNKNEIKTQIKALVSFGNIIIKFGRYEPDKESHYDETLGVKLASPNQYAERIC